VEENIMSNTIIEKIAFLELPKRVAGKIIYALFNCRDKGKFAHKLTTVIISSQ